MKTADFRARVKRISHKMLDVAGAILDRIDPVPPAGPLVPPETGVWRWAANQLGLWQYCAKPACRRARRCRGEPRACLDRRLPQVPERTRAALRAVLRARRARQPTVVSL
jgi:hypothetical protein